jgi:protein-disulfide isomerase
MSSKSMKNEPSGLSGLAGSRKTLVYVTIAAIIVVALLIAANLLTNRGIVDPEPRTYPFASGTSMGKDDSPVEIVEFSDFQCPFCAEFHLETLPQILENYIETGKVKFTYRNYTILGPNSFRAAKGALCAEEQSSFWLYHDYLFANQNEGDPTAFSNERLEELAESAGLDVAKFRVCLIDDRTHSQIDDEFLMAQNAGANSTPSFLVNGTFIRGSQSYEVFEAEIEAALANGS